MCGLGLRTVAFSGRGCLTIVFPSMRVYLALHVWSVRFLAK